MARPKKLITEQDVAQAESERKTIKDWHVVNRLSAVIAYATHTAKEVAKIFNVTPVSVINWAHDFHERGVDGLRDAGKGHRQRKLSGENAETVRSWVVSSRNAAGKRVHWTLKLLCIEIKSELGIDISCSALSETLAEMGLVIKRPRPMNYKFDPGKAEDFKKKAPEIVRQAESERENLVVMFEDEGRFGTMTTVGRQWCERGTDFIVRTKQGRENMYAYAAVAPKTGRLILETYEKANTETQQLFLEKVSAECKGESVLMFMDCAAWHTTRKLVVPTNVRLAFLPPVSPQLNPVEHLWKHIRTVGFHNVVFDSIADVYKALDEVVMGISEEKVKTLCACTYL